MAFFTRSLGAPTLNVTTDDGDSFPVPDYMANQLQASGIQEQPVTPPVAAPVAAPVAGPAPAPPPDLGPVALAPAPVPIANPSLPPLLQSAMPGAAPAPAVPAPMSGAPVPASTNPATVSPTAPVANAPLAGATPMTEEDAARQQAKVDPAGLTFGSSTAAPADTSYTQPYQGPTSYFDKGDIARLALQQGGGEGFGLMGRTVQHQEPLTGPHREAILGADQAQMTAAREAAEANSRLIDAQATAREQANAMEFERQKARAARVLDLQKKRDDALAAIPKGTDPNAWDKAGGIGRLLAVIASSVGGYASGMTGMANPGMQMLQAAQRDSIDAQKEEIRLAEQRGDVADNLYQKALDEFGGDPVAAENMVNLAEAQAMANTLQGQIDTAQDDVLRAGLSAQLADVNAQIAQHRAAMDGQLAQVADQYGAMSAPDPLDRALKVAQLNKLLGDGDSQDSRQEKLYRESQVILPDGSRAWAKDAKAADAAQGIIDVQPQIEENMSRLLELSGTTGRGASPELRAEIGALVQSNKMLMKQLEQLGAITSADQELISPLTGGDVGSFMSLSSSQKKALEVAIRHVNRRVQAAHHNLYKDPQLSSPLRPQLQSGDKAPE